MFAAVSRVASHSSSLKIDDQIQHLQRNLTDENWNVIRHFHHVHGAETVQDGDADGIINRNLMNAGAVSDSFFRDFVQTELLNQPRRQGQRGGAGIHQRVFHNDPAYLIGGR